MDRSTSFNSTLIALAIGALASCTFSASTGRSAGSAPSAGYDGAASTAHGERPAVVRYYSPPLYQSFVSRSVPYQGIADASRRAALDSVLRVREADMFKDDYYKRRGTVVMLGMEDGALVGFTTRYSVDILYPDDDLIRDGVGRPDFREHELTLRIPKRKCRGRKGAVCALRYQLHPLKRGQRARPSAGNQALYRTFGDNDAVLVYFPAAAADRLRQVSVVPVGLRAPTRAVTDAIQGANRIMGQEFVLVSPTSLKLLRKSAGRDSVLASYGPEVLSWAAGLVGAHTVVKALLKRGFQYVTMDRRRIEEVLIAKREAPFLARELVRDFDFRGAVHRDGSGFVDLPALSLIDIPREQTPQASAYLHQVIGEASVELILFGTRRQYAESGMLFVPAHHLNLNYELLRAGLARLKVEARHELSLFPEFAEAAHQALSEGVGFAGEWSRDRAYVAAVDAARLRRN